MLKFNFTPFHDLKSLIGQEPLIDVMALVLEKRGQRLVIASGKKHVLKEYALINEEGTVVILALWNNVAKSEGAIIDNHKGTLPLIRAVGLNVSPHYEGSLGSTSSTSVVIDPDIPQSETLKAWRARNFFSMTRAMITRKYLFHSKEFVIPPLENIQDIAFVLAGNQPGIFVVQVHAVVINCTQMFFYMGCEKCCIGFKTDIGLIFRCPSCKNITRAKPREKVALRIFDSSGFLDATSFGSQAAAITGVDCIDCMDMHYKEIPYPISEVNKKLDGKSFLMKLKKKKDLWEP